MSLTNFKETLTPIRYKFGEVTATFGSTSTIHKTPHTGVDYSVPAGTLIHAPYEGIVSRVKDYGDINLGKAIFVKLNDGKMYVVGHLSEFKVKAGQIIHKGDLLGISGNTGRSTGAHLHFGVYDSLGNAINPSVLNYGYSIPFTFFTQEFVASFSFIMADVLTSEISKSLFEFIPAVPIII